MSVAADAGAVLRDGARIDVIHNAVDLRTFGTPGPAADLDDLSGLPPAPEGTVRVGLVATFGKWKGHDVFLRALAAVPADAPVRGYVIGGALYETAGSQHSERELRALAASLGLEGRVGFTGFTDPAPAMRALDIVVHASTEPEPFGLVIAEAMAAGRPVVTSALGGAAELVEAGVDALSHRAGDPASLTAAILRLARSRRLRACVGARAARTARRRFDPRRMARQLSSVYDRVASPAGLEVA